MPSILEIVDPLLHLAQALLRWVCFVPTVRDHHAAEQPAEAEVVSGEAKPSLVSLALCLFLGLTKNRVETAGEVWLTDILITMSARSTRCYDETIDQTHATAATCQVRVHNAGVRELRHYVVLLAIVASRLWLAAYLRTEEQLRSKSREAMQDLSSGELHLNVPAPPDDVMLQWVLVSCSAPSPRLRAEWARLRLRTISTPKATQPTWSLSST